MKCIIVDDVPMACKGMRRLVEGRRELELIGMYENAEDALAVLETGDVDLMFLDIQMAGMNGMELARKAGKGVMVVFTTAYSEYAVDSYEVNAIDYLVKPIDPERFDMAVERALLQKRRQDAERQGTRTVSCDGSFLTVKSERRYVRIRYEDILYVEGSRDMVVFQLADGRVVSRATVKSIEDCLPGKDFMRVNKSYIVNLNKVTAFDNNDILIGRFEIAIGPTYRDEVLKRLLGG